MCAKFVSDVLDITKKEILENNILKYRVIELISGVGSGKTSWIRHLANTKHDGKYFNIFFLTSRRIVVDAEKNKNENARYWMDFEELIKRDKGIGKGAQRLIYCTNSKIENYLQTKYNPEDSKTHLWNYFDFIILDEAHSLAMDATYTTTPFLLELGHNRLSSFRGDTFSMALCPDAVWIRAFFF